MTTEGTNLLLKLKERELKDIRKDEREKALNEFAEKIKIRTDSQKETDLDLCVWLEREIDKILEEMKKHENKK